MTSTVTATYAKIHLGELLNRVGFSKEKVFIKRNNKTIAVLSAVPDKKSKADSSALMKFAGSLDISDKEAEDWINEVRLRRQAPFRSN